MNPELATESTESNKATSAESKLHADLKKRFPGCVLVMPHEEADGTWVFPPKIERIHVARYMQAMFDARGDKTVANERLILDVLRYPSREEAQARFEERPGLLVSLVDQISRISGVNAGFSTRPL